MQEIERTGRFAQGADTSSTGRTAAGTEGGPPGGPTVRTEGGLPLLRRANRARAYKVALRHTILVRALRVILPVCALATAGLYALNAKLSARIGGAEASIERIEFSTENLRMISPRLEGVTASDGRYVVTAKTGTQEFDAPDIIHLEQVDARVTQPNDDWVHLVADTGRFETRTDKMDLKGNIRLVAKNGMNATLRSARIDIKAQRVVSREPVRVDMPNGHIDSDTALIDTAAKTLSFVGTVRVKLFKRPQPESATE